ncbi:hypothetical protein M2390_000506 [Mycetocola sp. BIGb0189]|uniref:hypothetical protein n=1 Tax=Mycetocola sp. BIGb0189 TaxID=2940604 RepID=UPI002168C42E|nr:hypothetical protein [Mycetocola sp. BIGb0189]MCS4275345.1 hypothetical protein [Mycetocola sp. BIGb0189]
MGALTIGEGVLWVVAVAATLAGLRKVWPSLKALGVFLNALSELPRFMAETRAHTASAEAHAAATTASLAAVKHEVLPNHGGSMRDAVDRNESATGMLSERLASVEDSIKSITDKLGSDHTRIAVLEERTQPRDERGRFTKGE